MDAIAKLSHFIPPERVAVNAVDCAIAEILDPALIQATLMAKVGKLCELRNDRCRRTHAGQENEVAAAGTRLAKFPT